MLCDSNILIYAAEPGNSRCAIFVEREDAAISCVTRIEVLGFPGWKDLSNDRQARLQEIIHSLVELPLSGEIIQQAIGLRQQRKMSLADAIIAATALTHSLPLVTRNIEDFRHILDLRVIDPFND